MNPQTKTVLCVLLALFTSYAQASGLLEPQKPIPLPGKAARFDFMETDSAKHRILAAHKGAGTLAILDLKSGKPLAEVEVGEAQGVAVDQKAHQYLLGDDGDHKIVVVDSKSLQPVGEIKVDGAVDAITFDSKNRMLYADEDNGNKVWVIDTAKKKVATAIAIPGKPEVIVYDSVTDRLYQNIKDKDSVVRIDPTTNEVDATWSTLPAKSPHGMAIDGKRGQLYVAGGNGKLVVLDLKTGKVAASADIASGTDQIAYDAAIQMVYCASKGFISVVKVNGTNLQSLGDVPSPKGAHTLAVDPSTHDVWVSYSDADHSYFQRFKVKR